MEVTTEEETKLETVIEKPVEVENKAEKTVAEKPAAVPSLSAATERMNAKQFFQKYPHDNKQVVNLIIALYGNQIKTRDQWEEFYNQILNKKVSSK